jgi:hypothetical protein
VKPVAKQHLPGHSRKRRDVAAIFANFHDSGGGKLLEAGLQFGGEFHATIIDDIPSCNISAIS